MLQATRKILGDVRNNLLKKGINPVIKVARHFEERLIERFDSSIKDFDKQELKKIERAIEKALEKLEVSHKAQKYVHPAYGIVVVAKKLGTNYLELVTCYKKEVAA